jgi:hypothetical protein
VGNGREDGAIREGRAAASGEKPLKVGCPWTNRHETWPADPRREQSRERQPRPVGVVPQGDTDGRASEDWHASEGPHWRSKTCPGEVDGSFGSGRAPRSAARKAEASWGEGCGGKIPDAEEKSMRGGCCGQTWHHPADETTRINPRGPRSRWLRQTNRARGRWDRDSGAYLDAMGKADAD